MDGAKRSALEKGLAVLESVLQHARLSDIVADTDLPNGTVHRILGELVAGGWVIQDEWRQYFPGRRMYAVAGLLLEDDHIVSVASPFLAQLRRQSGHTVHLGVHKVDMVVHVARLDGPDSTPVHTGTALPLTTSALGKAVLSAHSPDYARDALHREFPRSALPAERSLFAELSASRSRGWAVDDGATYPGLRSVAAPVYSSSGIVIGGVSIQAPADELRDHRIPTVATLVREAALRISEALGSPI